MNLSQSELAKKIGVSLQTIYRFENDRWSGAPGLVYQIAAFFGVSVEDLDYESPIPSRPVQHGQSQEDVDVHPVSKGDLMRTQIFTSICKLGETELRRVADFIEGIEAAKQPQSGGQTKQVS